MTSANDLSRDEQYRLVYQGICAVAANCDGAIDQDGVGFNGQDTKFGRRIAAVGFEDWTDAVKEEAARIALTYKAQIAAYTGIDVAQIDVVREANDLFNGPRNPIDMRRQARDDARTFEKRAKATGERTIECSPENLRAIWFRFPFDAEIKDALKAQGAKWNGHDKVWWIPQAPVTPEIARIAEKWFTKIDPAVRQFFETPAEAAPAAPAKLAVHGYVLNNEVVFNFPYNPVQKDAVKAAGARWEGSDKTWRVRLDSPKAGAVVAAARSVGLNVTKEVDVALGGAAKVAAVQLDRGATLVAASRVSRPSELSPEFLALVNQAIKKAS